jgi:hypothetical protein
VHELVDIPDLMGKKRPRPRVNHVARHNVIPSDPSYGELPGGRDIYPDEDGFYTLIDEEKGIGLNKPPPPELIKFIKVDRGEMEEVEDDVIETVGNDDEEGDDRDGDGGGLESSKTMSSRQIHSNSINSNTNSNQGKGFSIAASDVDVDVLCTKVNGQRPLVVRAAPMVHKIPCVGFVVEEKDKIGKLDADLVFQERIYM